MKIERQVDLNRERRLLKMGAAVVNRVGPDGYKGPKTTKMEEEGSLHRLSWKWTGDAEQ